MSAYLLAQTRFLGTPDNRRCTQESVAHGGGINISRSERKILDPKWQTNGEENRAQLSTLQAVESQSDEDTRNSSVTSIQNITGILYCLTTHRQ